MSARILYQYNAVLKGRVHTPLLRKNCDHKNNIVTWNQTCPQYYFWGVRRNRGWRWQSAGTQECSITCSSRSRSSSWHLGKNIRMSSWCKLFAHDLQVWKIGQRGWMIMSMSTLLRACWRSETTTKTMMMTLAALLAMVIMFCMMIYDDATDCVLGWWSLSFLCNKNLFREVVSCVIALSLHSMERFKKIFSRKKKKPDRPRRQ